MVKQGFDNNKYLQTQSAHIRERLASFGGKLYVNHHVLLSNTKKR